MIGSSRVFDDKNVFRRNYVQILAKMQTYRVYIFRDKNLERWKDPIFLILFSSLSVIMQNRKYSSSHSLFLHSDYLWNYWYFHFHFHFHFCQMIAEDHRGRSRPGGWATSEESWELSNN